MLVFDLPLRLHVREELLVSQCLLSLLSPLIHDEIRRDHLMLVIRVIQLSHIDLVHHLTLG